jgi:hypothetical protein
MGLEKVNTGPLFPREICEAVIFFFPFHFSTCRPVSKASTFIFSLANISPVQKLDKEL